MIKIELWDDQRATAFGPFPFPFIKLVNSLSGRKFWPGDHQCKFEATPNNLRILESSDHQIQFVDKTGQMTAQQIIENMPTQHAEPEPLPIEYVPGVPWYKHQSDAIGLSWFREWYALLFDVGLGKTAILIANCALLWLTGKVTGVLVLAPKGPHRQWIEEEVPKHIAKNVPWEGVLWKKKPLLEWHQRKHLTFFVMNTDAVRTKNGIDSAIAFLKAHNGKSMLIVDESSDFKSNNSDRSYNLEKKLKPLAAYRRIADGTPISKNVVDLWTQFNFLDLRILGFKYLTPYKQRFCITKPGDNSTIVGHKNIEELYSLIAPHSFRMRQEEAVGLPEKIYTIREYEMSEETEKHYKSIKETLLTEMEDGRIVDAVNPAVAMMRLHQVVCGFLSLPEDEDGAKTLYRFGGERVAEAMNIIKQVEGPVITWARFIPDRFIIAEALEKLGEGYVIYEGSDDMRAAARRDFMNGTKRHFISNQKTGGVGNNLQGACRNVIFYSNSFQARLRWQAEGRTTRIGTLGTVNHFDLVARKSVDRTILRNLKMKKDLADLTLDDIRRAIVAEA